MTNINLTKTKNYFDHDADIGIMGYGESIESCFSNTANMMFALMTDISQIHQIQIVTFEFDEEDIEIALVTWLNLLLAKALEHRLILGDFRLKREGKKWKATVAGEKWREGMERSTEVKRVTRTLLSVKKIDHVWEARCVVEVN